MDDRQLTALLPEVLQTRWSRTASCVTPLAGPEGNLTGLTDARWMLRRLGLIGH